MKYRYKATPLYAGNSRFGALSPVWNWDLDALLVNQGNYRLPNGSWSGGGAFYTYHNSCHNQGQVSMPLHLDKDSLGTWKILGVVGGPSSPPSSFTYPTWGQAATAVQSYIPRGYKLTRPGNPVASLGQFLIELRDLPTIPFSKGLFKVSKRRNKYGFKTVQGVPFQQIPKVLLENLTSVRNLGSEYLNVVFGWKPLLSDLRKMYHLWQTVDKRMGQIIRENGKAISRRATVDEGTKLDITPTTYNTPWVNCYGGVPAFPTFDGKTLYTAIRYSYYRVWYMAKYQYYIPDVGSSQWTARARAALFGALPTPELLWEVLPWSWLIDWFTNVGDIYSNISPNAVDNLVSLYSYTMRHEKSINSFHAHVSQSPGDSFWVHPGADTTLSTFYKEETKLRFPGGSPFVLNAQGADFSPYQLGVLAALGLSRSGSPIR